LLPLVIGQVITFLETGAFDPRMGLADLLPGGRE